MRYDELKTKYDELNYTIELMKKVDATTHTINEACRSIKEVIRYDRDHNHDDPLEVCVWKYGSIGFDNKRHLEDFEDSCRRYRAYRVDYVVEDIDEFKEENRTPWYNPYNDGRDCTGVWFTTHMNVVPIAQAGYTVVIEYQGMDV